jgi:hypothetical protein
MLAYVGLLLLAVPLAAQDPVTDSVFVIGTFQVPTSTVTVEDTTFVEIDVEVHTDSLAVVFERLNANLAAQIAALNAPPSTTERVLKTAGWWALGIIALVKLHQIANRPPSVVNVEVINEGDNVTVNVPDHEHPEPEPHDHKHGHGRD